jgi:molybdenum cofactor cytidylyltransferase
MPARLQLPTGIILAAGLSRRMQRPKQLLPWGSGTVIEEVASSVRRRLPETVVVLGHLAHRISPLLSNLDVSIAVNPEFEQGMLSSVKCGIAAAAEAPAYLVFLGDQPVVDGNVIDAVIDAYAETGSGIVIPVFGGKRGHPVLISSTYAGEVLALGDGDGLNVVTRGHPEDTLELAVETETVLEDMDTPADYQRALNRHGESGGHG